MGAKARVVVTRYENPVEPVVVNEAEASNLHFGEMTPAHARRERRRRRHRDRREHPATSLTRLF